MLTATRGPYVLVIQPDDDPFNPREDDNFGKMVCFHRRYHLGDHHNYIDKDDFLRDLYLKTVGPAFLNFSILVSVPRAVMAIVSMNVST